MSSSAATGELGATLVVAATITATSRAGSVNTEADVQISPHVLTAGQTGLITIKFLNKGPSTVNHVVATVTAVFPNPPGPPTTGDVPIPAGNFTLPTGCQVVQGTSSRLTCDIGQVPPGLVRRVISFIAPATITPSSFFVHVSASFDEGKNSGLVDTVTGDDPFPFSIGSGTDTKGQCTALGSTLTAGDTVQQTALTYQPLPPTLLPCTPVSAGVDAVKKPIGVAHPYGEISFVDFLDGAGLATVNVNFLSPPKCVTKKNLAVYELARYPIDLTATNGGAPVPNCVTVDGSLQIPSGSGFVSCVVLVDTLPGGGLFARLLAKGGADNGYGGAG